MTSTSPAAELNLVIEPGADFTTELYLPGDYHAASGTMHVRKRRETTIVVSGTVTFGAYDSINNRTLMTLSMTNTTTSALGSQTPARYDVLVTLGALDEFWVAGTVDIPERVTQPGVP